MKFYHLWPVAVSLCSAIVIPNEQVLSDLAANQHTSTNYNPTSLDSLKSSIQDTANDFQNSLDEALESGFYIQQQEQLQTSASETSSWISNFFNHPIDAENIPKDLNQLPHHLLPCPLFPPHHPSFSKTIYELIKSSKYTTILASIIDEDEDLGLLLNSIEANHTVFVPTDHAFSKLPHHHHHHKIPRDFIRAMLRYHVAPGLYPASQIFHSHTVPTILNESALGTDLPLRLAVRVGWTGLKVNFYSRIVASNIGASNGIIHGIDSILLPPPSTLTLLNIVPSEFSTFTLGLLKTGLDSTLNDSAHHGSTIFAPSNSAFQRLGFKINAFLFSPVGHKYLRALLQYHIVQNRTLFSDVFYTENGEIKPFGIKGFTHLDLPTLLQERKLAIDVARFGPYASLKINGFQRVAFADALAKDGTVHVVDHVLIPPRKVESAAPDWTGADDELTLEDLKSRLGDWLDEEEKGQEQEGQDDVYILPHGTEL